jgi:aminopeptidase YwaD
MRLALIAAPVFALAIVGCSSNATNADSTATPGASSPTSEASPATSPPSVIESPTPLPDPELIQLEPTGTAEGPANHDSERAIEHARTLSIEPRVSGTPAEVRAAEYIAEEFRSYGYLTEIQEFNFDGDRFRAGEIAVAGEKVEALTMAGSPGGQVTAPAAYVALGDAEGIDGQDLTGKVAVADRGILNFGVKYQNVRDAGAVGLIIVNNMPGLFSGNLTLLAGFPVVSVSQEEGQRALDAAAAGDSVTITTPPTVGLTRSMNVVARASADTTCTIVVGGHFDSVPSAPGANDNASGTANVLELARATAVDGLDEGVCFVAFGAEESGLYGSKAFVAELEAAGEVPSYMINLDVTGIGNGVEVIGDSELASRAIVLARSAGIPVLASVLPANSGSDHQSFAEAGAEVVFFSSGNFSTIHSPEDVFEDLEAESVDRIGDAAYLTLTDLLARVAAE